MLSECKGKTIFYSDKIYNCFSPKICMISLNYVPLMLKSK